jgi:tRNA pseudouridine38-40 synthase
LEIARKLALIIEYNGTRYYGSQRQVELPTIQGEMEKAVEKLAQEAISVSFSSRTDAGVHAKGQVVSFKAKKNLSVQTWLKGLNFYLPRDIVVKSAYWERDNFDVRRQALSREYRYTILNREVRSPLMEQFTYQVFKPLNVMAMEQACRALVGEHDFRAFSPKASVSTMRRIYHSEILKRGELVIFNIKANSFLPHQVRHTVGGLIQIGLNRLREDEFQSLAFSKIPGIIGPAVPPQGLCLMRVNYADFPPK